MSAASTACGACTVRVDDVIVRGCLTLAVQCDGARVETIEHLGFRSHRGPAGRLPQTQCVAVRLLHARDAADRAGAARGGGAPSREAIRAHLAGNYRCTGYQAIVDAIESVAQARKGTTA